MYNDVFYGKLAEASVVIEAERRKSTEQPRTWSFMTPYLTAPIDNIDAVIEGVLIIPRAHDAEAAILMHYVKCRNPDDTVLTWAWAFQLLIDLKEATSSVTNDVISESRLAILSAIPQSLVGPIVTNEGLYQMEAALMLAYAMGVTTPHSVDEAVDYCVMVQHLRAKLGAQLSVTNLDKHWFGDDTDLKPRVEHFKVCEMPARTEAIEAVRKRRDNEDFKNLEQQ